MFDNIGGKIKRYVTGMCLVGILASIIWAIVLWSQMNRLGYIVLIGGCTGTWGGSIILYGFGELIEETTRNREINQQILSKLNDFNNVNATAIKANDVPVPFSGDGGLGGILRARAVATGSSSTNGWSCRKCGAHNATGSIECKRCGVYK